MENQTQENYINEIQSLKEEHSKEIIKLNEKHRCSIQELIGMEKSVESNLYVTYENNKLLKELILKIDNILK